MLTEKARSEVRCVCAERSAATVRIADSVHRVEREVV